MAKVEFWPFESRDEGWWKTCYLQPPLLDTIVGQTQWTVITGPPGCGKSVLMQALQRVNQPVLKLEYGLASWPQAGQSPSRSHFEQWMAEAGRKLQQYFAEQTGDLSRLSPIQQEFLSWMIGKYQSQRAYQRWAEQLTAQGQVLHKENFDDLYASPGDLREVGGQLDELIDLCRKVGFRQIWILVDVPLCLQQAQIEQLQALFSWLEPMQHPGFRVVAAVPTHWAEMLGLRERVRGRAAFLPVFPDAVQKEEIICKHLLAASGGSFGDIRQLMDDAQYRDLSQWLQKEFADSLQSWLYLAEEVLRIGQGEKLDQQMVEEVRRSFYEQHIRLWMDVKSGLPVVWRGGCRIELQRSLFELLSKLYRLSPNQVVDHQKLGLSKEALYQQVSRLRKAIEPLSAPWIYLKEERDSGYWLEKKVN